jgi:hypothetical protein
MDETMRTAPVPELTQAEMFCETGAAVAAVAASREQARTARLLMEDIQTSQGKFWIALNGTEKRCNRLSSTGAKNSPVEAQDAGRGLSVCSAMGGAEGCEPGDYQ